MAQEFSDSNFDQEVIQSTVPVLVDFWAPWCGPCRVQLPLIDALSASMNDGSVKIGKINVDENPVTAQKYGVLSIPTLLIFKGGQVVKTFVGVQQEDVLRDALNSSK